MSKEEKEYFEKIKESFKVLQEEQAKLCEWQIFNSYLIEVLLQEKFGVKEANRIIKKCQTLAKIDMEEKGNE